VGGEGGAQRRRHACPRADLHRLGLEAAEASLGRLDRRGVGGGELGATPPAQEKGGPRGGVGGHAPERRRAGVVEAGAEGVGRGRHDRHRRRGPKAVHVDDGGGAHGGRGCDEAAQAARTLRPRHPRHV